MMTAGKLKLLQVAKMRLDLSEDDYRATLDRIGGVHSAKDLDDRGFDAVMDYFRSKGFVSTQRQSLPCVRYGMASPAQLAKITDLFRIARAAGRLPGGDTGRWLEHTCKVSSLRFLTRSGAVKAITGLKAITARAPPRPTARFGSDDD